MSYRQQVLKLAAEMRVQIDVDRAGGENDITLWAERGKIFAATGGRVAASGWAESMPELWKAALTNLRDGVRDDDRTEAELTYDFGPADEDTYTPGIMED